jgi:hypothetical protein
MEISEVLFDKFTALRKPSDAAEIAAINGCSKILIYKALQTRKCSQRVLDMLISFYAEKEESIKSITN